ncbi:MAG: hypothetical protein WDW38_004154 [Sanguina aurantia]
MPRKKKVQSVPDITDQLDAQPGFGVDEELEARFEYTKHREEKHRLGSKFPERAGRYSGRAQEDDDDDDDSSSAEDEDDGILPDNDEAQIFETLMRIKRKDPQIYQSDIFFFGKEGDAAQQQGPAAAEGGEGAAPLQRKKKMFLKDVLAQQALEHGAELDEDEEDEGSGYQGREKRIEVTRTPRVYDAEQQQLRQAFLSATQDPEEGDQDGFGGGVLRKRQKLSASGELVDAEGDDGGDAQDEGVVVAKQKKAKKGARSKAVAGADVSTLLDEYFGQEADLTEGDRFLKKFIQQKSWLDKDEDGSYVPSYREVVGGDDGDGGDGAGGGGEGEEDEEEKHLQHADRFEAAYNFRYEEPGSAATDERRKKRRAEKALRQADEEGKSREELKRMKNVKKEEISSRLRQLQGIAGKAAPDFSKMDDILDGDFDPDAWDKKMAAAFDDDYYDAEDDLAGLMGDEEGEDGLADPDAVEMALDADEEREEDADGDSGSDDGMEDGGTGVAVGSGSSSKEGPDGKQEASDGDGGDEDGGEGEESEEDEDAVTIIERPAKAEKQAEAVGWKALKRKMDEVDAAEAEPKRATGDPAVLARQRAELQRMLQEYYTLDYEDNVGGIKTRFRYKQVAQSNFGLSVDDILKFSDKELNTVAGLKRLAPYREDLGKQRPNYKALEALKSQAEELWSSDNRKNSRPHSRDSTNTWKVRDSRSQPGGAYKSKPDYKASHPPRPQPAKQETQPGGDAPQPKTAATPKAAAGAASGSDAAAAAPKSVKVKEAKESEAAASEPRSAADAARAAAKTKKKMDKNNRKRGEKEEREKQAGEAGQSGAQEPSPAVPKPAHAAAASAKAPSHTSGSAKASTHASGSTKAPSHAPSAFTKAPSHHQKAEDPSKKRKERSAFAAADPQAARLASYAKLTLKREDRGSNPDFNGYQGKSGQHSQGMGDGRPGNGKVVTAAAVEEQKVKRQRVETQAAAAAAVPEGLSKAARKNFKRTQKRGAGEKAEAVAA